MSIITPTFILSSLNNCNLHTAARVIVSRNKPDVMPIWYILIFFIKSTLVSLFWGLDRCSVVCSCPPLYPISQHSLASSCFMTSYRWLSLPGILFSTLLLWLVRIYPLFKDQLDSYLLQDAFHNSSNWIRFAIASCLLSKGGSMVCFFTL